MNTQPFATKTGRGVGLVVKIAAATTLLAVGVWAFSPGVIPTGRWTVSRIVSRIKKSLTPGPMDYPVRDVVEVEPAAALSLSDPPSFGGDDWPGWRGIDGSNCSPNARCPAVWSEEQNIKWRTEVPGRGHSSPVVVGSRLFVTTAEESPGRVLALALDKETGREIWCQIVAEGNFRSIHEFNSHASSTPICDGQNLFVASLIENSVYLSALSASNGEILWNTYCGPCTAKWGFSGSLAFWRGLVYLMADNPEGGWIAAFTAQRGELAWLRKRPPAQEGSYSSPIVAEVHGMPQVVAAGAESITAYQPESGAIAWTYQGIPNCCVSTVVLAENLCVATGGWPDRKLICIRVNKSPTSDEMTPEMLWETDKASDAPYIPTPLHYAGKLYLVHDQGIVTCRDLVSGKIGWKRRLQGNFNASPVLLGGNLLLSNVEGVSSLLDPSSGKILAQNSLSSGLHASPIPSRSGLFLRADDHLYCIGAARSAD